MWGCRVTEENHATSRAPISSGGKANMQRIVPQLEILSPGTSYSPPWFIQSLLSCFWCPKLRPFLYPSKTNVPANIDSPDKGVTEFYTPYVFSPTVFHFQHRQSHMPYNPKPLPTQLLIRTSIGRKLLALVVLSPLSSLKGEGMAQAQRHVVLAGSTCVLRVGPRQLKYLRRK